MNRLSTLLLALALFVSGCATAGNVIPGSSTPQDVYATALLEREPSTLTETELAYLEAYYARQSAGSEARQASALQTLAGIAVAGVVVLAAGVVYAFAAGADDADAP